MSALKSRNELRKARTTRFLRVGSGLKSWTHPGGTRSQPPARQTCMARVTIKSFEPRAASARQLHTTSRPRNALAPQDLGSLRRPKWTPSSPVIRRYSRTRIRLMEKCTRWHDRGFGGTIAVRSYARLASGRGRPRSAPCCPLHRGMKQPAFRTGSGGRSYDARQKSAPAISTHTLSAGRTG
jgi:hypothetical protein